MTDEPRRPRRDAIAPIVGLVVPDPVPREHTGPVHFDPASIDRPTVARRADVCRSYDPWCCYTDETGADVSPLSCRTCGGSKIQHDHRQAIPTIADGPGLLTYSARHEIDASIRDLCRVLGVGDPAYVLTDIPGGKCHLTIDIVFDAATANERNK